MACASACSRSRAKASCPAPCGPATTSSCARLRADFADVDAVTIVTRQASGDEIGRLSDVAVRPGQREILNAFSAAHLRTLPATRVRSP